MLSEELVMDKARETMSKEGFDLNRWHPMKVTEEDRTTAPDGTPDIYFKRILQHPNHGGVDFTDGKSYRRVQVQLEGDRLICNVFTPL